MKLKDVPYIIAKESIDYLKRRLKAGGFTQEQYDARIKDGNLLQKLEDTKRSSEGQNNDDEVYMIWSASKITLDVNWVLPLKHYNFEGFDVTSFARSEDYLSQHFGVNYYELPPYELRGIGIN